MEIECRREKCTDIQRIILREVDSNEEQKRGRASPRCYAEINQCRLHRDSDKIIMFLSLSSFLLDSPRCSSRSPFPPDILTALGRPINLTCHMNNGNPSKINFTWHLPNGHIRLGHYLNATSSYITVIPKEIDEFGPTICRAQNDLGLFGQCHLKMILGGSLCPLLERDCSRIG